MPPMMAQFGRRHRRDPTSWIGWFELLHFAGSTAIYQAARFGFSIAAARLLAPDAFALWALIVTALVYAPSLLGGVANGMARELPIISAREGGRAAQIVATTWLTCSVALSATAVVGCALIVNMPRDASILGAVTVLVAGTVLHTTQQMMLRSVLRFGAASLQLAIFGVGLMAAGATLAAQSGGGDVRLVAAVYAIPLWVSVSVGLITAPRAPLSAASSKEFRRLLGIGFPIMLAGLSFSLFVTMDRWLAVQLLGAFSAGPYALASLVAAALLVLPSVISQQTYPRMAVARGHGATPEDLRAMARTQGRTAAALTLPVSLAVVALVQGVIPWLIPAYSAAIPAVMALIPGLLLMTLFAGYGNYLNVAGAQWRYLGTQLVAIALGIALMTVGGIAFGLVGIAVGMSFSLGVYGLLLYAVAGSAPFALRPGMRETEVGDDAH